MIAVEFSRWPPHPLACGETLPPRVEKGKKASPTPSFSTRYKPRATRFFHFPLTTSYKAKPRTIYTPQSTRYKPFHPPQPAVCHTEPCVFLAGSCCCRCFRLVRRVPLMGRRWARPRRPLPLLARRLPLFGPPLAATGWRGSVTGRLAWRVRPVIRRPVPSWGAW